MRFVPIAEDLGKIDKSFVRDRLAEIDPEAYVLTSPRYGPRVTADVLDSAPSLTIVSNEGGTTDPMDFDHWIDIEAIRERGIKFTTAPGSATPSVAEGTMALLLALNLNLAALNDQCKRGSGGQGETRIPLIDSTLGIVGMGNIGQRVSRLAHSFGMSVVYTSSTPNPSIEVDLGAEYVELPEVFSRAECVSIHVPYREINLISDDELRDADGILLVNTAHPQVVHPEALTRALEDGRVARVAIEGKYPEPYQSSLREFPDDQVLLLPSYTSWDTEDSRHRMWTTLLRSYLEFMDGKSMSYRLL